MRPQTLSASALKAAAGCLRRYKAEYLQRGRGIENMAASTGSACHGALEKFVRCCYIDKTHAPTIEFLEECFKESFSQVFHTNDFARDEYVDGWELLSNWHTRTKFDKHTVLSVEKKLQYMITLSDATELPLTYIIDRLDLNADGEIEIVDYKTNRFPISHEELKQNIQARIYALMQQIEHPEIEIVWVTFDLLRHDRVTVSFSRQDNTATWIWLAGEVARILETSEADAEANPTLNPECNFCAVKATCPKLTANIQAGGIFSLSPEQLVDLKVMIEGQTKGLKALNDEVDSVLGPLLRPGDGSDNVIQGTEYDALVASRVIRNVDSNRVNQLVDPLVLRDYIKPGTLTMAAFEKLCKDPRLEPEVIPVLRSLVSKTVQAPSIKVVKRA